MTNCTSLLALPHDIKNQEPGNGGFVLIEKGSENGSKGLKTRKTQTLMIKHKLSDLTFPQNVHRYFECCVISIFLMVLRREAP
jgi:hypothetical protein